jgi:hypothetical protein
LNLSRQAAAPCRLILVETVSPHLAYGVSGDFVTLCNFLFQDIAGRQKACDKIKGTKLDVTASR